MVSKYDRWPPKQVATLAAPAPYSAAAKVDGTLAYPAAFPYDMTHKLAFADAEQHLLKLFGASSQRE